MQERVIRAVVCREWLIVQVTPNGGWEEFNVRIAGILCVRQSDDCGDTVGGGGE